MMDYMSMLFKRSTENYTELHAKNISIDFLRQAFVYTYTDQGTLFWEQKQWEYEQAKFTEVSHEDMAKDKWYCDVDDMDDMSVVQFSHCDDYYIYFKVLPGEQEYFDLDENGYVKINNNFKFFSYGFKKQGSQP
jgi:hypothetical protein